MSYCTGKNIEIARGKAVKMLVVALKPFLFISRAIVEGFLSNFWAICLILSLCFNLFSIITRSSYESCVYLFRDINVFPCLS